MNRSKMFTSILWTGTDIFMAFLLGPILRNVSLSTRKEVISWLMPKMVFYMPTVASVTTTAGYFLSFKNGFNYSRISSSILDYHGINYCYSNAYSGTWNSSSNEY